MCKVLSAIGCCVFASTLVRQRVYLDEDTGETRVTTRIGLPNTAKETEEEMHLLRREYEIKCLVQRLTEEKTREAAAAQKISLEERVPTKKEEQQQQQ